MNKSIIYIVLGAILLGGLFLFIKPGAPQVEDIQPQAKVFELVVKNDKLVSGPATIRVTEGDLVVILITADRDNELHIHGYDKSIEIKKDQQGEISFTATTSGRFEFELHEGKIELGAIEVMPKQ